jgi:protocatechuate 3,4-dioxygenase beta subunit
MLHHDSPGRRRFLAAATSALFTVPGLFAEKLTRTPAQTEGPFYPDKLPLDTDNDLLIINGSLTPAVGQVTWLSGRILTAAGSPIRNAMVEIWQVDGNGVYLHKGSSNGDKRDAHFQGFGRFLTGSSGEYLFRTVKPVPYPGRTGHIHFSVKPAGSEKFVTQCYVKGEPLNEKDGVLKKITDPAERKAIIVPFAPLAKSSAGELAARFDIVLGFTPPS